MMLNFTQKQLENHPKFRVLPTNTRKSILGQYKKNAYMGEVAAHLKRYGIVSVSFDKAGETYDPDFIAELV